MSRSQAKKFLHSFVALEPTFLIKQEDVLEWMKQWHEGYDTQALVSRYACKSPAINSRGSWVADFSRENPRPSFVSENAQERNTRFQNITTQALDELYRESESPQNIMHVTCTGYVSPSCVQILVSQKKWQTQVAHAYHMGCYASIPAVRLAHNSDIVHTELCSLHFNPKDRSPEQIVIQSLFADGILKYSVSEEPHSSSLEVIATQEVILPDSLSYLTWQASDTGFLMTLDRGVPKLISQHLLNHVNSFLNAHEVSLESVMAAIHPGGPKIIELSQELLSLSTFQVKHSKEILFTRGNMSSATLPHVWNNMLKDSSVSHGQFILSVAFGPGLTLCMSLFKKVSK